MNNVATKYPPISEFESTVTLKCAWKRKLTASRFATTVWRRPCGNHLFLNNHESDLGIRLHSCKKEEISLGQGQWWRLARLMRFESGSFKICQWAERMMVVGFGSLQTTLHTTVFGSGRLICPFKPFLSDSTWVHGSNQRSNLMTYRLQRLLFGLCSRVVLSLCLWLSSLLEIVPSVWSSLSCHIYHLIFVFIII